MCIRDRRKRYNFNMCTLPVLTLLRTFIISPVIIDWIPHFLYLAALDSYKQPQGVFSVDYGSIEETAIPALFSHPVNYAAQLLLASSIFV